MKQWLEKTVCKPGFNNILIPNLLWQASSSCAISNPRAQCSIILILQTMARVVVVLIVILLVGLVVGLVLVLIHPKRMIGGSSQLDGGFKDFKTSGTSMVATCAMMPKQNWSMFIILNWDLFPHLLIGKLDLANLESWN